MKESRRDRLRIALSDFGRGARTRFAAAAGKNPESVRSWLAGSSSPPFDAMADACAELGISLDWIAYGTRAPAIDEAELAKALLLIEQFCTTAQLSAADRARAVHLIYMRAMEAPGRPLSRAELLRLFSIPG